MPPTGDVSSGGGGGLGSRGVTLKQPTVVDGTAPGSVVTPPLPTTTAPADVGENTRRRSSMLAATVTTGSGTYRRSNHVTGNHVTRPIRADIGSRNSGSTTGGWIALIHADNNISFSPLVPTVQLQRHSRQRVIRRRVNWIISRVGRVRIRPTPRSNSRTTGRSRLTDNPDLTVDSGSRQLLSERELTVVSSFDVLLLLLVCDSMEMVGTRLAEL